MARRWFPHRAPGDGFGHFADHNAIRTLLGFALGWLLTITGGCGLMNAVIEGP